jgi:thiol-disulfide isomerase/thioredoxin
MRKIFRDLLSLSLITVVTTSMVTSTLITKSLYAQDAPSLTIGSKAPSLDIEHWVSNGHDKFKPVTTFEKGNVYVVEFWATWCGPCIASMPHLAETQEKYASKKVQLVSVSDEDLPTVEKFLAKPVKGSDDKEQTYSKLTGAYCLTTDPDKSVYETYMDAAGQNGIPTAFIVGKSGFVEWIGHPMEMDEPLDKVVEDKWDRDTFAAEFKKAQARDLLMGKINQLARAGKMDEAMEQIGKAKIEYASDAEMVAMLEGFALNVKMSGAMRKMRSGKVEEAIAELDAIAETAEPAQKIQIAMSKCQMLVSTAIATGKNTELAANSLTSYAESKSASSATLNMFAWNIFEASQNKPDLSKGLIAAATKSAERAVELDPKNAAILDTLAHLLHAQGATARAIEIQTLAVQNAEPNLKAELTEFLEQLKKK